MIKIDGAIGGGSVVRIAVGLACALRTPVSITNIRKRRPTTGLRAQHLAGLLACTELTNAKVKGAKLGSEKIKFYPRKIHKRHIEVDIPTAGSVSLALQPIQLACLNAPYEVTVCVKGGATFGKWAPPVPYLANVNFDILRKFGYLSEIEVQKHGFFPKGGAQIKSKFCPPVIESNIEIKERGKIKRVEGFSIASNHLRKAQVAKRQAQAAEKFLEERYSDIAIAIKTDYTEASSPGSGIVLWAICENTIIGADSLGERGKPSEEVGSEAGWDLIKALESEATLDRYMSDQIIPLLGLYGGTFQYPELTTHIKTNTKIVQEMTGRKFQIDEEFIRMN